ncbi:branched-chain amino acid ABC transporter substrate-binding protein [Pseudoclavibacter chungangensis]|uniref:Branched-chain amino acid ABC transporter substrate-binding protein n=1 Tax=Pseudoclavibacter chungangensis TaxID=587635 RepID=A0A7J5C0R6_9MICO|nr:branched-chain amino acid ABC transporter substrate-binding protein [Pseudoclavibacter chungangensis]KAB1662215.1 branched-chain amino acid ABC transporter substrate-binding protein [Pseudoclavibacter chungangensis]NYJ65413.1 branched-chain amino acid transport system substrate-binding protein [Pseudoclavibacter chungangensis]
MSTRSTRRSSWRTVFAPIALAATAVLTLAGCSGGLAGGGDAASEDGPIKLGMAAPFSGSESAFGPYMQNGAQLAIDEINAAGGVLGRQLELVTADDACDATSATAAANKLVTDGIVASVGGYCSGATLPTLPIFEAANIPMVIPAANSNELVKAGLNNVFLINGTGTQQAEAAIKYAAKEGLTNIALLDDNTDYAKDLANSVASQAADGGVTVVLQDSVNAGESDYAAAVNKIVSSGAQLLYWTGYYQEGGLIVSQLKAAGYTGQIMVGDGSVDAKFAEIAGPAADGVLGTFTQTPDMLEGAETWISDYTEKFGAAPGPYSTQSYDAVRVVAEAITNAGTTDGEAVITALEGLKDFPIFSGSLTFSPEHTLTEGGFAIVTVGPDGTFVLKDDLKS